MHPLSLRRSLDPDVVVDIVCRVRRRASGAAGKHRADMLFSTAR